MNIVVVREYARLTVDEVKPSLDQATVSSSAFNWLCSFAASFKTNGADLLQIESTRWLKLDNFVGVVQTPCGTLLEVLPKQTESIESGASARELLIKMLTVALDLPVRNATQTGIATFKHSLLEWVMSQFVHCLDQLIKKGLRFDYQRVEEEQRFLRSQLDTVRQMRQPPGRAHIFNIRHDIFTPDRPENRLLKLALMLICKTTQQANTWRLSHELAGLLTEIPESKNSNADFRLWKSDRLMAHYQPIRIWCELVLGEHMPLAMRGKTQGISMLFPMERLFERYVEVQLQQQLPAHSTLTAQARSKSLCQHNGRDMFQLRPDFIINTDKKICLVMDAKWKLISSQDIENKYGLSQADFYQLYAYGHKYLNGQGELILIYPAHEKFKDQCLNAFEFSDNLKLWVVPFDLETDTFALPEHITSEVFLPILKAG